MSWAKLDDGFWDHPKILAAGNEAAGMFARALSYTARQELDGRVPQHALAMIGGPRTKVLVSRLVSVGLFEPCAEGVVIHDYLDFNPSREQQCAKRKATLARVSRHRNAVTPAYTPTVCNTAPVPTRPDPSPKEEEPPPVVPRAARRGREVSPGYSESFTRFWSAYPRREGKGVAWEKWRRLGCDALLEPILAAVERQRASEQWVRDGGKFIPHPATWLHGRRWEDEGIEVNAQGMTPDEQRRFDEALAGGRRLHA